MTHDPCQSLVHKLLGLLVCSFFQTALGCLSSGSQIKAGWTHGFPKLTMDVLTGISGNRQNNSRGQASSGCSNATGHCEHAYIFDPSTRNDYPIWLFDFTWGIFLPSDREECVLFEPLRTTDESNYLSGHSFWRTHALISAKRFKNRVKNPCAVVGSNLKMEGCRPRRRTRGADRQVAVFALGWFWEPQQAPWPGWTKMAHQLTHRQVNSSGKKMIWK